MHILQLSLYMIFGLVVWISTNKTKTEKKNNTELLLYKDGVVTKEKFVYYSLEEEGDLKLTLNSLDGDADIYVAENSKMPTYEPEKYALHSATFGEDIIDIPRSLVRPVVIGIYGHSLLEQSSFELKVERIIHDEFEKTIYSDFVKPYPAQEEHKTSKSKAEDRTTNKPKIKSNHKLELKSLIFSILEVIASVL